MNRSSIPARLVSTSRPALLGLLFGLLVTVLLIISDQLSIHFGLGESQRIVDDIIGGVIAGFAVFGYARVRLRYVEERLNTISLMNHHIRNALQVIRYAGYIQPGSQQVAEVDDAIKRIDWALREVLSGRSTAYDEAWKQDLQAGRTGGLSSPSQAGK